MAGIENNDENVWEHMDEEAERLLIRIMDEQNRDREEYRAPAIAAESAPASSSTFLAVATPSEPEAEPADSSPVVGGHDEKSNELAVEQPRTSSPPPGEAQSVGIRPRVVVVNTYERSSDKTTDKEPSSRSKLETVQESSLRNLGETLDAPNTVRSERVAGHDVEEAGEETQEHERGGQPVHEVSRDRGEATLTLSNVLGGAGATVGCTCRPDVTGSTSGMAWSAVDCCVYNRQRAQQNEREVITPRNDVNKAMAGPSRQADVRKCPSVNKKRARKTKRTLREENRKKKTKRSEDAEAERRDDIEIDVKRIANEVKDYEEFCAQNKDDPTLRELVGVSETDDDDDDDDTIS